MSTATKAAASPAGLLERVERTAWRIPLPTRRLFVTLALVAAGALAVSGLAAGWVASRNAATIEDAREQGLDLAIAATEFRTGLVAADARAAGTLIAGGLESTESRAAYDEDLLAASQALTEAGLVATGDDRDDISAMSDGLVRYAGLVETSRANTRLGYPVGSAYLDQARALANDDLVPRADRLRRVGEQRIARATNSVGGPVGALAVALLAAALVVLVGCALIIAGRTRRIAHPALAGATVVAVAGLAVMAYGIATQTSELRQASSQDVGAYGAANDAASSLSNLRVTEISAVAARGSGGPLYDEFAAGADDLQQALVDAPGDRSDLGALHDAVGAYRTAVVDGVQAADERGDNREAARLALPAAVAAETPAGGAEPSAGAEAPAEGSAQPYEAAVEIATANVDAEADDLAERFDAVDAADVSPFVPVALGAVAALLAAAGTLARGRRYR